MPQCTAFIRNLPKKSQAHLADSRIPSATYHSETGTTKVSARIEELSVIEHIEELKSEIDGSRFRNRCTLGDRKIGVQNSRSMEKAPICRAEFPELSGIEGVREEIGICPVWPCEPWILRPHRTHQIRNVCRGASDKREILILAQLDGKPCRKSADSRNIPSFGQSAWTASEHSIEWNRPVIAHDKVMGQIECRKGTTQPIVGKVHPFSESG